MGSPEVERWYFQRSRMMAITCGTLSPTARHIVQAESGIGAGVPAGGDKQATASRVPVDAGDYARFLRELDVLGKAGLLEWQMAQIPLNEATLT